MKQLNINYTLWEKTVHFFGMIWFILKEIGKLLTKRWFWLTLAFILWTYLISWFNSNYQIKASYKFGIYERTTPIKKPTVVPQVKAQETKPVIVALSEEQIVKKAKHGDELWNIYMLESTRGKNDGCRLKGIGYAGFGVMGASGPQCYPTFEKAVERAEYWYERIRKNNDISTSLCIWNLGQKVNNCMYYQKYMSL